MAWLTRTTWTTGDVPSAADFNSIGLDLRTRGGDVNGGGYDLTNNGNVYLAAGKKLGIGTATPGEDITISGAGQHQISLAGNTANKAFFGMFNDTSGLAVNRSFTTGTFTDTAKSHGEIDISGGSSGSSIAFATAAAANTIATTRMTIKSSGIVNLAVCPTYASDSAAGTGGLVAGDEYKHSDGSRWTKL